MFGIFKVCILSLAIAVSSVMETPDEIATKILAPLLDPAKSGDLEAIPAKKNLLKSAKITEREVNLAKRWHRDSLISPEGLKAIEAALNK